ncbi:anticoagulant protein rhipilin-2 [Rhipicephalus microplus]|uniref:anticoagulant protein rhipilin-2 n=1 Tax=Rhipicephalus microplus TaxID=6941 RepID=UPI003F6B0D33
MIFTELVFFSFVLSSKGTKLEPTCPNKTRNQRVLWNCYNDGTCYEKSFYYNAREDKCEQFEYKGCGGNGNNFPSLEDCTSRCKRNMTSYDHIYLQRLKERNLARFNCTTPYEASKNDAKITRFYYDSKRKECRMGIVSKGDNYFPALRYCLFMCNTTEIVPERCQRPMKIGRSTVDGWKCHYETRYNVLFCNRSISTHT